VFLRLERLIRLRNSHPAFDGEFRVRATGQDGLSLGWRNGEERCELTVDVREPRSTVDLTGAGGRRETIEL
jgi:sucrose phosphorylase